jgi:hypothetical protein
VVLAVVAGIGVIAATAALAKIVNPDLAAMPPVMRKPPVSPAAAPPPAPAASVSAPRASPTQPRSRRPTTSKPAPPSARPVPNPAPPLLLSYEAESAQLGVRADVYPLSGASGGRIVRYIGDSPDNYVRFSVTVPATDRYTAVIYYVSDESRNFFVRVNDRSWNRVYCAPTGSWTTVGSRTLTLDLSAGVNTVDLGNAYRMAPDLDRITISA